MSADNGIIIKKKRNRYYVYHYCASVAYDKTEDMDLEGKFKSLEEAIHWANDIYTEYGIQFEGI